MGRYPTERCLAARCALQGRFRRCPQHRRPRHTWSNRSVGRLARNGRRAPFSPSAASRTPLTPIGRNRTSTASLECRPLLPPATVSSAPSPMQAEQPRRKSRRGSRRTRPIETRRARPPIERAGCACQARPLKTTLDGALRRFSGHDRGGGAGAHDAAPQEQRHDGAAPLLAFDRQRPPRVGEPPASAGQSRYLRHAAIDPHQPARRVPRNLESAVVMPVPVSRTAKVTPPSGRGGKQRAATEPLAARN